MSEFEYKGKVFTFTEKLLKEYEVICVKSLNYNVDTTTVYDYLKFLFGVGVIFSNDYIRKKDDGGNSTGNNGGPGTIGTIGSGSISISNESDDTKVSLQSNNIAKLKSVVAPNFYSGSLSDKICSLTLNVLDIIVEGKCILKIF